MITRTLMREKGRLTDTQVSPHEENDPDTTRKPPLMVGKTRGEYEGAAGGSVTRPTTLDPPVGTAGNPKWIPRELACMWY